MHLNWVSFICQFDIVHLLGTPGTFYFTDVSRRQNPNKITILFYVKTVKYHYCIRNPREKCIEISTNMPGIGLVIRGMGFEILRILKKGERFSGKKPLAAC